MKRLTSQLTLLFMSALLLFAAGCDEDNGTDPNSLTNVRVIHTSYDAPNVDVSVDGSVAISDLAYGQSSGYAEIGAGSRNIVVTPNGATTPEVINTTQTLDGTKEYTIYAVDSLGSIDAFVSEDDRTTVANKARVRFLHASPDAPAVDIRLNTGSGTAVFNDVEFKEISSYVEVDGGAYTFVVTEAGATYELVVFNPVTVNNGSVYTVVAHGTFDPNDSYPFAVRVFVDDEPGSAYVDLTSSAIGTSNVRVIHTSYDAPGVDVRIDGSQILTNLTYGNSSGFASVASGDSRDVQVFATGTTTSPVIDAPVTFVEDEEYTIFAVDQLSSISPVVVTEDRTLDVSNARVRFLHASPDAPAVDIKLNTGSGTTVFGNTAFESITAYTAVPPASYTFVVTAAGMTDELFIFEPISVSANTLYTVVAHGTLDATDNYPFAVRIFVDNGDGDTYVDMSFATTNIMAIHASPDEASGVDLLVDGAVAGTGLTFTNNTGYLEARAGQRNLKVNATGTMTSVIDTSAVFDADKYYSVFAADVVSSIVAVVIEDDLSAPASGKAHVRFVHLSPDAPTVDITLDDGTVVFDNIAFKEYTPFTPLDAGTYPLEVRDETATTTVLSLGDVTFEDGKIYTVFARGLAAGSGNQALGASIIVNNE